MSGEGERLLGEGDHERRRLLQAPPALYATAPLLDSTEPEILARPRSRMMKPAPCDRIAADDIYRTSALVHRHSRIGAQIRCQPRRPSPKYISRTNRIGRAMPRHRIRDKFHRHVIVLERVIQL